MSGKSSATDVQKLAAWAKRASFDKLSRASVELAPIHVLDCLGCAIAALGAPPVAAMRAVLSDMGDGGPSPLIGGGASNLIFAAMWHTALVRYLDFMDNFLAPKETCHTADNFGAVLTTAAHVDATGEQFVTALAVSYTAQSRYVDHGTFMERGLDHTAQLGFSICAATGLLLGLDEAAIANGAAMATSSDSSYANIRAKPLTQWKGLASSQSALGAMNAILLARRGVKGPLAIVEGRDGVDQLLGSPIKIDWKKEGYEGLRTSTIKRYNAEIHTQSAIECMLDLRKQAKIDPSQVKEIEAVVSDITYNFTGGGSYGSSTTDIDSKEQADHSLQYLLAVALIDGEVTPAQFKPERIKKSDVQELLLKIKVKPDKAFTKVYPHKMPARITVKTSHGKPVMHEVNDYPGMPDRPFTWNEALEKFSRLCKGRVDDGLRDEIAAAAQKVENTSARQLMSLLAKVKTPPTS